MAEQESKMDVQQSPAQGAIQELDPKEEAQADLETIAQTKKVSAKPAHMDATCFGYCVTCEKVHELRLGASQAYAQELLEIILKEERLDFESPPSRHNPKYTLEKLFPGDRSHMLGVLECRDSQGATVWLKAYSSLPGGYRKVPGWVPMIISKEDFDKEVKPVQRKIKELSKRIERFGAGALKAEHLTRIRKRHSQELQEKLPSLYWLYNHRKQKRKLQDIFYGEQGVPGGAGECCAPKLLNHAARKKLKPISLAEFFWGKKNASGERDKALFRICCADRCQPIMGFMLCGLDAKSQKTAPQK